MLVPSGPSSFLWRPSFLSGQVVPPTAASLPRTVFNPRLSHDAYPKPRTPQRLCARALASNQTQRLRPGCPATCPRLTLHRTPAKPPPKTPPKTPATGAAAAAHVESQVTTDAAAATDELSPQQESLLLLEWPSVCRQVATFCGTSMAAEQLLSGRLPIGSSQKESELLLQQTAEAQEAGLKVSGEAPAPPCVTDPYRTERDITRNRTWVSHPLSPLSTPHVCCIYPCSKPNAHSHRQVQCAMHQHITIQHNTKQYEVGD
jgi:hypothetical protein